MAQTKPSQRVLFAVILILMVVSTVGMYVGSVMGLMNPSPEEQASRDEIAEFQRRFDEYKKWSQKMADKYSQQYYEQFKAYQNVNEAYNAASVKELKTKDLKVGDGAELAADTPYQAFYLGWLPSGEVFDGSFDGDKLKMPIEGGNLITGWNEGIVGMKIGGVRELTIPADKAYGEAGSGKIPANSPIKFVIMAIPPMTAEEAASRPQL